MLEVLFEHSPFAQHFAFKGGTSLSKSYQLINRFSELKENILINLLLKLIQTYTN